jgi:hypothetical protein
MSKPMIKESHRGELHKELHVAPGKKIGHARLASALATAKREGNVKEEKQIVFAENFGRKAHAGASGHGSAVKHMIAKHTGHGKED